MKFSTCLYIDKINTFSLSYYGIESEIFEFLYSVTKKSTYIMLMMLNPGRLILLFFFIYYDTNEPLHSNLFAYLKDHVPLFQLIDAFNKLKHIRNPQLKLFVKLKFQ